MAVAIEEAALEAGSPKGFRTPVSAVRAEGLTSFINHLPPRTLVFSSPFDPSKTRTNPRVFKKWGHFVNPVSFLRHSSSILQISAVSRLQTLP